MSREQTPTEKLRESVAEKLAQDDGTTIYSDADTFVIYLKKADLALRAGKEAGLKFVIPKMGIPGGISTEIEEIELEE